MWTLSQTCFFLYLSARVGFHWAGKQSMRHVSLSTESPGATKWACCHPVSFECFITAYTEEQLPTARSLTSGQQCRRSRRGLHCPAAAPASTRAQAGRSSMKDDLERTELLGTRRATSVLIIHELLTMVGTTKAAEFHRGGVTRDASKNNSHLRHFTCSRSCTVKCPIHFLMTPNTWTTVVLSTFPTWFTLVCLKCIPDLLKTHTGWLTHLESVGLEFGLTQCPVFSGLSFWHYKRMWAFWLPAVVLPPESVAPESLAPESVAPWESCPWESCPLRFLPLHHTCLQSCVLYVLLSNF